MSYEQSYDKVASAFNIAYELYERDPELAVEISICLEKRAKEKEHIEAFRRGIWRGIEENGDERKFYKASINIEPTFDLYQKPKVHGEDDDTTEVEFDEV